MNSSNHVGLMSTIPTEPSPQTLTFLGSAPNSIFHSLCLWSGALHPGPTSGVPHTSGSPYFEALLFLKAESCHVVQLTLKPTIPLLQLPECLTHRHASPFLVLMQDLKAESFELTLAGKVMLAFWGVRYPSAHHQNYSLLKESAGWILPLPLPPCPSAARTSAVT